MTSDRKRESRVFISYSGNLEEKLAKMQDLLGDKNRIALDTWKHYPHVAFANWSLSPRNRIDLSEGSDIFGDIFNDVSHFLFLTSKASCDDLEEHKPNWDRPAEQKQGGSIDAQALREAQDQLRLAWHGDREKLQELDKSIKHARFEVSSPIEDKVTSLVTQNLWAYLCLRFMNDHFEGRTRICGYRDCVTRYFVSQRLDQKYCKHSCAVKDNHLRRAQASEGKSDRGAL
jgi:hypothetical protein